MTEQAKLTKLMYACQNCPHKCEIVAVEKEGGDDRMPFLCPWDSKRVAFWSFRKEVE